MAARRMRARAAETAADDKLIAEVASRARTLHGWEDLDPLMERVGEARLVLLGEASHGTSEFYQWRRQISQRLIREKGFSFIAVEGDWPDCYQVNRYVKGAGGDGLARSVLGTFSRWPTWMWANLEIAGLVEWLRQHNAHVPADRRVGFYGLDVYSLWDSMHAVLEYLEQHDGQAAAAARRAFQCFEPFGEDVQEYAQAARWIPDACEDEVVGMLTALRRQGPPADRGDGEAFFNAEQNALIAQNAERYYRTMVRGDSPSWNVRDRHMIETLDRLMRRHGPRAKAIVWEHNTHVGDARATDMVEAGMVNVGQLAREEYGPGDVVIVGFSTYQGTVIAGREWEAPMEVMSVPPGRADSWEDVLHRSGARDKLLLFDPGDAEAAMAQTRGHRAIGVVYRPHFEHYGNYVPTQMPRRYDMLVYIDQTTALHPLGMTPAEEHELPETFPTGL